MKKVFAWSLVICMMFFALIGCAPQQGTPSPTPGATASPAPGGQAPTNKDITISVISKGYQHEFWRTVELGTKDAANELGVKATFIGPEKETEIAKQVSMVENAINQKVSAIVLAALDKQALLPVVQKANDAGIPILTFDSSVEGDIPLSFVATDNVAAGAIAGEEMAKAIGQKGKVGIVAHNAGTQTAIDREKGFRDAISKYPDITVLNTQFSDGDKSKALSITQDIMTANPDIAGIYGTNEGSAVGVARAVQEKGKAGKIAVIGFDSSADEVNFINEGVMNGIVVQNPYQMGYQSIVNAVKAIQGGTIEKRIDTGATFVHKGNINDAEIEKLIYPLGKQ